MNGKNCTGLCYHIVTTKLQCTAARFQHIIIIIIAHDGWLSSRVVSVLDSGTEGLGSKVQITAATLLGNSLRQTVHTHHTSVHQAAKLVADLFRVARVTAGLAESNGSLPSGL